MRIVVGLLAALLAACLAAAWLVPPRLDLPQIRAAIEAQAGERLGATVRIDGKVHLALLPVPALDADTVSLLHGAPGDPDALAVTADRLRLRLDVPSLFAFHLRASDVSLAGATLRLSWPFELRDLVARPAALRDAAITLDHARALIGDLAAEDVNVRVAADPASGETTLGGTFVLGKTEWRGRLAMSVPGRDGSAALDARLEDVSVSDGPTVTIGGQIASDGRFSGRLTADGANLARLFAAPAVGFHLDGRAEIATDHASLRDAALVLDGAPGRLAASLRLLPAPSAEVTLGVGRLDLDAWRAAWRAAPATPAQAWPLSLHVSAAAATLAGGALRQLDMLGRFAGNEVDLSTLSALLPGEAEFAGSGHVAPQGWRFGGQLDAPDLRALAAWLVPMAGLRPLELPSRALRSLSARLTLQDESGTLSLHGVDGLLDQVPFRADAVLSPATGGEPARLAALVSLDRLDVAPWLDAPSQLMDLASPQIDASLVLSVRQASFGGLAGSLSLDGAVTRDAVRLRSLRARGDRWQIDLQGSRGADARWSGVTDISAAPAGTLAPLLPEAVRDALAARPGLAGRALRAHLSTAGPAGALSFNGDADLGDLHIEATPTLDLPRASLQGGLRVRDPDARGLLAALFGPTRIASLIPGIGPGSLSSETDLTWDAGAVRIAGRLQAGALAGEAMLHVSRDAVPSVTGRIDVRSLPPLDLDARDAAPLPLRALEGWSGELDLAADTLGEARDLRGHLTVADGVASLHDLSARVSGGEVSGAAQATLGPDSAKLTGTVAWRDVTARLKLAATRLMVEAPACAGRASLQADGFSPAALLATLSGRVELTAPVATLVGIGLDKLDPTLSEAAVESALADGATLLSAVTASGAIDHGLLTGQGGGEALAGRVTVIGHADLTGDGRDALVTLHPSRPAGAPSFGLRVTAPGTAAPLSATPELAELLRWRATLVPGN